MTPTLAGRPSDPGVPRTSHARAGEAPRVAGSASSVNASRSVRRISSAVTISSRRHVRSASRGHRFDEAQFVAVAEANRQKGDAFVVVESAQEDGVHPLLALRSPPIPPAPVRAAISTPLCWPSRPACSGRPAPLLAVPRVVPRHRSVTGPAMPTDPGDELSRPHPSHLRRNTTRRKDDHDCGHTTGGAGRERSGRG